MNNLKIGSAVLSPHIKLSFSPKLPRNMIRTSVDSLHELFLKSFENAVNIKDKPKKHHSLRRRKPPEVNTSQFSGLLSSSTKPVHLPHNRINYARPGSVVYSSNYNSEPLKLFCHRKVLRTPKKKTKRLGEAVVGVKANRLRRPAIQINKPASISSISRCSSLSHPDFLLTPKLNNTLN